MKRKNTLRIFKKAINKVYKKEIKPKVYEEGECIVVETMWGINILKPKRGDKYDR